MTMKKKILSAAVLAALGAGSVQAVNLSEDGTGQVLLFPYYTVQNGEETLFSVVNTTGKTKALKVRFREAYNSREVLDFNLYMSPYDVWVAKILPDDVGGAKVITPDNTCTVPTIPEEGQSFRVSEFTGALWDGAGDPDDPEARTREGYIEVIEMGVADDSGISANTKTTWDGNADGVNDAEHEELGDERVPNNCAGLTANWTSSSVWKSQKDLDVDPPEGGVFGSAAVINVGTGTESSVPATVLENFSARSLHFDPGTTLPTLVSANPAESTVILTDPVSNDLLIQQDDWRFGIDAVSAVLMAQDIINEYTVNKNVGGATDWVVTFPTKWAYTNTRTDYAALPFVADFLGDPDNSWYPNGMACEPVEKGTTIYDREEDNTRPELDFSPSRPTPLELCYEVNVVNFAGTSSLSAENTNVTVALPTTFSSGWARFQFLGNSGYGHYMDAQGGARYEGLPVIGYRASSIANANVGVGASYSVAESHKYTRVVSGS